MLSFSSLNCLGESALIFLNYHVFLLLQKFPIVKETLPSLPSAMIHTQDSGCLMILTSGSVILVTLELMFSWVMQVSVKV